MNTIGTAMLHLTRATSGAADTSAPAPAGFALMLAGALARAFAWLGRASR